METMLTGPVDEVCTNQKDSARIDTEAASIVALMNLRHRLLHRAIVFKLKDIDKILGFYLYVSSAVGGMVLST